MDASSDAVSPGGEDHIKKTTTRSDELDQTNFMTIMQLLPGVVAVVGEVPEGFEPINLNSIPSLDQVQLSKLFGSIANFGTVAGNMMEAVSSTQGLYRVSDATLEILKSGGELAAKDGAKLGAIFKNGKLVAQARFIPASMTAATVVASIGPAIAMLALQMQLGEISRLARTNIDLTTQTLNAIQMEQWAELDGLVQTVDEALQEAARIGTVIEDIWDPIKSDGRVINKQVRLYQRKVVKHVQEIGERSGLARRQYLEHNAEAIIFETYALLNCLKMRAGYQMLRATAALNGSVNDENEAKLSEIITQDSSIETKESLQKIGKLTDSLVRELRIIAKRPDSRGGSLMRKSQAVKSEKLLGAQLLQAIEPFVETLHSIVDMPSEPAIVCAPAGFNLAPYLKAFKWILEDGEQLRAIALPYLNTAELPVRWGKLLDAAWRELTPGNPTSLVTGAMSVTFVVITDRRIITANPKALREHGEFGVMYPLETVELVYPRSNYSDAIRPTIGMTIGQANFHWVFPAEADLVSIDSLVTIITEIMDKRAAIEGAVAKLGQ